MSEKENNNQLNKKEEKKKNLFLFAKYKEETHMHAWLRIPRTVFVSSQK